MNNQKFRAKLYKPSFFLIIIFFFNALGSISAQEKENYHLKTVVIDPGHGGKDSGARGRYSMEKDLVLEISLKLGKYIEKNFPDIQVIYTRKTDTLIPLYKRAEIANKNKADLFISVHINANSNTQARGTETYAMGLHKSQSNLEVAQKENAAILYEEDYTKKYEGFDPNSAESYIIFSLIQNAYLKQSLNFASSIQKFFTDKTKLRNRGVKQAGFLVLYKTTMPRVLIEAGFISNPREEDFLNSPEGKEKIAQSIFNAFKEYKEDIESNSAMLTQSNASSGITFKLQIAASSNKIPTKSNFFKGYDDVEILEGKENYKYTIGQFSDYEEAVQFKEQIKSDFPGAFVIAVQNNQIIPLQKAISQINN
jgi:N-acetylmuramoyl-L-alanine amidase